jgi:putative ABC transport system ATP-binding protein
VKIRFDKVSKDYECRGQIIKALDCVTLEIPEGDFVSLIGPSGSGKTTLLLMLGGMLSPSNGTISLEGQSLYDLTPAKRAHLRRQKLGFVFQTFNLVPYLTAMENVQVPLLITGLDASTQNEKAKHLLDRVGLADRFDHKPSELSVGQQQRVALARMLANEPDIILADEPTGNLDPDTGTRVIGFLEELNGTGKTVVMVTHDPCAAERTKRTFELIDGTIVAQ